VLDRLPGWRRAHADGQAVVHADQVADLPFGRMLAKAFALARSNSLISVLKDGLDPLFRGVI
jgi:hypothetical protein